MEKAAVSLAVAAVSSIITKLSNTAASFFGGDITPKDFDDLKTTIFPKIMAVIEEADKINSKKLRPWLMKLKKAAYEAEDVLDEYEYIDIENKVSSLPSSLKKLKGKAKELFGELLLKTTLKKSLEKLRESANEADKLIPLLSLISQTDARQHVTNDHHTTVSGLSSPVFGRDEELKSLINLLVDNSPASTRGDSSDSSNNIHVHAICGAGGAGKTTLAQYFCSDERVVAHFELKLWVHVFANFNATEITRQIFVCAGGDSKLAPGENLDGLQKKVREILKSKTFLLVLDDIWCEDRHKWDELLIPFNGVGNNESRILITTRTEHVASILGIKSRVSLNELKTEDCRSILKHYAVGGDSKYIQLDPDLQDVLQQIVQKLKHSPLAARVIGCLLGQKVNIVDWRMILKDDLLKGTKDTLVLSFYHLPSHLQRCFAFCSLYPKGFRFTDEDDHIDFRLKDVDDLVRRWIALGFVECPNNVELTLEERGRQYFNNLVSYSFFQHLDTRDGKVYVIHDLLHDLAEEVSKDDCLRIEGDESLPIPKTIMHLSITSDYLNHRSSLEELFMLDNLRTFMILSSPQAGIDIMIQKKIFENLRKLRVLDLGKYMIQEFDSSVSQLKHLQYLKAGMVGKLSKSFCRLYHLQYLTLSFDQVVEVSKSFSNLINLRRVIRSRGAEEILGKVANIRKLTSLQSLTVYHAEFGLEQLKNLNQLHGYLKIEGLGNVKDGAEAAAAKLKDKRYLERLELIWRYYDEGDDGADSRVDEEVLEGLEPHPNNLQELQIVLYGGSKLPKWWMLNNQCYLHNLRSLFLRDCPNLLEMLSFPRRLQRLYLARCPQLKNLAALPSSLVIIVIDECPKIEGLLWSAPVNYANDEDDDNKEEEEQQHQTLINEYLSELTITGVTALKVLRISGCENLRYLEGIGSHEFLEHLRINECPELTRLGNLQPLPSLNELCIIGCPKLTAAGRGEEGLEKVVAHHLKRLQSFKGAKLGIDEPLLLPVLFEEQCLNSLTSLAITNWSQDIAFSARQEDMLLRLTSLSHLQFFYCKNLLCLPGNLDKLSSLQNLKIDNCYQLQSLPTLPASLESLYIENSQMESLPTLPASLESLEIRSCSQMKSLPELPTTLKSLIICNCHPQLHENYRNGGLLHHKTAHIPKFMLW